MQNVCVTRQIVDTGKNMVKVKLLICFCSDPGKLICLICMSVRESLYKSLTENNWEA